MKRPAFIISLDFELMWGMRDKHSIDSYGSNIIGGRNAIPKILKLFEEYGIKASWATVGLLFAKNKEEMLDYAPSLRPNYLDNSLSPYQEIQQLIGKNEKEDPWHYGYSLVDLIMNTKGQELATHTYSHYYCQEDGPSLDSFKADIRAAIDIAQNAGVDIKSIVFPRNQLTSKHINSCAELGISGYRGNLETFPYRSRAAKEETSLVRGARFIDSILQIKSNHTNKTYKQSFQIRNIPASRMLRPIQTGIKNIISELQLRRIMSEMNYAAISGDLYHLWWHPHNFGKNLDFNLYNLKNILQHYHLLQDQYGMKSLNMTDLSGAK